MDPVFQKAQWITDSLFFPLAPLEFLKKGQNEKEIECPETLRHHHVLFQKSFSYRKTEEKVTLRISADDYYKLTLNGRFVCQGPAQGYAFCYYYNELDLTPYLREGENLLTADVYYQGFVNRAYNSADRRMGLIAEALQGKTLLFATDESWQYATVRGYSFTHTMGYNTLVAENFDSRIPNDPPAPALVKKTDHQFSPAPAKLLQVYEKAPVLTEALPDGGLFYDFGGEITAVPRIRAVGKAGDRIRILFGEETEDSPVKVRFDMRCNCRAEEYWTLREGENLLEQYDYKAFRYMALIPEGSAEIRELVAVVRHYPFDDAYCTLETDDPDLQAVWQICKNGVKFGSQEVFTDCPLREKGQYAGDLTITGASHLVLTGDLSLFEKAMENQMQSARFCKGLMAVTPGSLMQEIADYSLQFPILALRHYAYTEDKTMLRRCLEVSEGILAHFSAFAGPDGLLSNVTDKWNLVDWPKNLRDGYDFPLKNPVPPESGAHNVMNAFYIGCVKQVELMRSLLGIEKEKESPALIDAFYAAFYRPEHHLFADSPASDHFAIQSNILPAYYGFCRSKEDEKAVGDLIVKKGFCCGVYMAYFALKALCRLERHEDALALLLNDSEQSWINMLREGATTCFEAWGKDQKFNTSLCHPWASAPISLLAEDILPRLPHVGRLRRPVPVPKEIY